MYSVAIGLAPTTAVVAASHPERIGNNGLVTAGGARYARAYIFENEPSTRKRHVVGRMVHPILESAGPRCPAGTLWNFVLSCDSAS